MVTVKSPPSIHSPLHQLRITTFKKKKKKSLARIEYDLQWNEHSQGQHSQGPKAIITSRITPGLHERAVATKT